MATVSQGGVITAAQYNTLQNTANLVLGTGSGTTGYGQTPSSSQIAAGKVVTAASWALLQADLNKCQQHQTGSAFTSGALPSMAGVQSAATFNLYDTATSTTNTNCNTVYSGNMTLSSGVASCTRASVWGNSGTPTITAQFYLDFTSNNTARYFFNTGGECRIALSHPSGSTTQDGNWSTALSTLGTITFKNLTSTRSGSGGTLNSAINFSTLTTSAQTILSGAIGTGSYTANTISVTANYGSDNSIVVITVSLTDNHTNSFYDSVTSGTALSVSLLKSTVVMTGIETPAVGFYSSF